LVVTGGTGADTVTAAAITTANVTLELSDGDNSVSFGTVGRGVLDAATIVVVAGSGDDTLTLNENTAAGTSITVDLGGGTNTLVLDAGGNISAGTQSFVGVDVIEMTGGGAASTVAASLVSGTTINVTATNTAGDIFTVVGTTAAGEVIDLSGLVMDQSITAAVLSTSVTGNAGEDTIVGTSISDAIATNGGGDTVTGGLGADTITLGAGADTVVIASADTGATVATADKITNFLSGTDSLSLGTAGSLANYTEIAGVAADTFALTVDDVNTAMDGTVKFVYVYGLDQDFGTGGADGDDGALFIDSDLDGSYDDLIILFGAGAAADLALGDIVV
jgi:Ca2+-binding RTX toxin-like protein